MKTTAIVLSAGKGSRMKSEVHKQYLELLGEPLICHTLRAFQKSPVVDEIVMVCGAGEEEYCRKEILDRYGFDKVRSVVPGGKERYDSVYAGILACKETDLLLIHDGARPCVTGDILERAVEGTKRYSACVVGMPVKDTIKVADADGFADHTPDRSLLWQVQTPQAFSYPLIRDAYETLFADPARLRGITDDAMVVEKVTGTKIRLIEGSYRNIKVTTPEDLGIAEVFLLNAKKDKK